MQKEVKKKEEEAKKMAKKNVVSFKRRYMKSNWKDGAIRCNLAIIAALHASWLFYYIPQAPSSTLTENTTGRHIQHNKGFAILMLLRNDNNTVLQEKEVEYEVFLQPKQTI